MSIRSRIILSFVLLVGLGFYFLTDYIISGLRPRYLEAVEESLVDQAYVLAAMVEAQMQYEKIPTDKIRTALQTLRGKTLSAKIYKLVKTGVDEKVYITDARGLVIFDSDSGLNEGRDYSQWRNIYLTLQGQYGARTTRGDPGNPTTSVLHVSAPIAWQGKTVGVLTVSKPTASINFFIQTIRPKIFISATVASLSAILLGVLFSLWVTRPIQKLTRYAREVEAGHNVPLPKLGHNEMAKMGQAFEAMREALEGKKYVEQYVQNLTHELKSPLSAVRGAAELLHEDMPAEQRQRFLQNIHQESERMQALVDRMLKLSGLENRKSLEHVETIAFKELTESLLLRAQPLLQKKNLAVENRIAPEDRIEGDPFWIEQALMNLIQNSIDFSPREGKLVFRSEKSPQELSWILEDQGSGVPDYAQNRIFEKFYSLPRPETGQKGTGLGLSFVQEIIKLHGGSARLENVSPQGARVTLTFPSPA